MSYLYFCIAFLWCSICVCLTFLFCARVLYVQKVEQIDPVNAIKTSEGVNKARKKETARKRIEHDELLERLLENG